MDNFIYISVTYPDFMGLSSPMGSGRSISDPRMPFERACSAIGKSWMGQSSKSGMSLQKHRGTGWKNGAGKSPKLRHHLKRVAEAQEEKADKPLPYSSVSQAFKAGRTA